MNTRIQVDALKWVLERGNYNVMATLAFDSEEGVSYETAKLCFGLFAKALKQHLFGRRSSRRIPMAPILEDYREQLSQDGKPMRGREGTHVHCLMELPSAPAVHKEVIERLWEGSHKLCGKPSVYCPDSDQWYLEISNEELRGTLTGYVLKRCSFDVDGLLVQYM